MTETTNIKAKVPKIYAALGKVMTGLQAIEKTERNKHGGYNYRGIDSLLNQAHGLLADAGIIVLPHCLTDEPKFTLGPITSTNRQQYVMVLKMAFEFVSTEDGSSVTSGPFVGEGMATDDKCSNKAQTAAFKWCFFQTFVVPVGGGMLDSEAPNDIDKDNATTKTSSIDDFLK